MLPICAKCHKRSKNRKLPMPNELSEIDLLQGLDSSILKTVSDRVNYQTYKAGNWVLSVNDNSQEVLFILSGKVRVTLFSRTGREIAFRDLGAGSSCGEIAAIDGMLHSANVVCLEDAKVARLSADSFRKMADEHPQIAKNTMVKLCDLVRSLSDKVYQLSAPVPQRICGDLLHLARQGIFAENSARIKPSPKHADVAARVLTHREAVSRTISVLKREGIAQKGRGELIIKDVERLSQKAVSEENI